MAIINEGVDASISAYATGNYNVLEGDVFNGAIGGGDTQDGVNFQGMTIGQEYTVTVTVDDVSDTTALTLINSSNFHSINYYITDGAAASPQADTGWVRDFVVTSPLTINGNTFSFNFTPLQHTSLAFQVMGDGTPESYSITFTEAVVVPPITEGADNFVGTSSDDNVSLLGGDDTFDGDAGNDTLTGGADNDVFVIGASSGADTITDFTLGADKIDLQALGINAIEDLTLTDVEGNVVIDLGDGNQITLEGRAAAELDNDDFILVDKVFNGDVIDDKVNGKSGVDFMYGNDGNDQLDGKAGDDFLDGGAGKDKLTGGDGNDVALGGGRNNDRLYGGTGNVTLTGDHGNDLLDGGDGNDILNGGIGKDLMTGGAGADIFIFEITSHRDTITDFEDGVDLLDFSGYVGVNSAADLFITQNGTDTIITTGGPASVTLLDTDALLISDADFIF